MIRYGAFSHKIDNIKSYLKILNLKGHQNRITGSRVMAILNEEGVYRTAAATMGLLKM